MGHVSWFYIEAKLFEDGASVHRFLSSGSVCLVLGKVAVIWMLATMDSLPQAEGSKEFA
jgi:hypothetical protein